ncbi:hypothetical protein H4R33_002776 [Dimargaris cristalligena]|nr:hypothetical protein H4R33_002776 [Dimargaris cristalligena]
MSQQPSNNRRSRSPANPATSESGSSANRNRAPPNTLSSQPPRPFALTAIPFRFDDLIFNAETSAVERQASSPFLMRQLRDQSRPRSRPATSNTTTTSSTRPITQAWVYPGYSPEEGSDDPDSTVDSDYDFGFEVTGPFFGDDGEPADTGNARNGRRPLPETPSDSPNRSTSGSSDASEETDHPNVSSVDWPSLILNSFQIPPPASTSPTAGSAERGAWHLYTPGRGVSPLQPQRQQQQQPATPLSSSDRLNIFQRRRIDLPTTTGLLDRASRRNARPWSRRSQRPDGRNPSANANANASSAAATESNRRDDTRLGGLPSRPTITLRRGGSHPLAQDSNRTAPSNTPPSIDDEFAYLEMLSRSIQSHMLDDVGRERTSTGEESVYGPPPPAARRPRHLHEIISALSSSIESSANRSERSTTNSRSEPPVDSPRTQPNSTSSGSRGSGGSFDSLRPYISSSLAGLSGLTDLSATDRGTEDPLIYLPWFQDHEPVSSTGPQSRRPPAGSSTSRLARPNLPTRSTPGSFSRSGTNPFNRHIRSLTQLLQRQQDRAARMESYTNGSGSSTQGTRGRDSLDPDHDHDHHHSHDHNHDHDHVGDRQDEYPLVHKVSGSLANLDSTPVASPTSESSFLRPGAKFRGRQSTGRSSQRTHPPQIWDVAVTVDRVDTERGKIEGTMRSVNVLTAATACTTYWEGEIVDFQSCGLRTGKWNSTMHSDRQFWYRFRGLRSLKRVYKNQPLENIAPHMINRIQQEYILMRWKERFFVDEADYQHHRDRSLLQSQESGSSHHGLTISGFYYICMSRVDGSIQGFYCDAFSCPYQKLELAYETSEGGDTFPTYSMA